MGISQSLMGIVGVGVDGILIILLFLSIACMAYAIDRYIYFFYYKFTFSQLIKKLEIAFNDGDNKELISYAQQTKRLEAQVIADAFLHRGKGAKYVQEYIQSELVFHRKTVERGLNLLGTVGSNAPFIGLFGTVLGIIKAFHDLSFNAAGGIGVVMAGIADALIATAVGLLVAIPAVVVFNFFQAKATEAIDSTHQVGVMMGSEIEQRGNGWDRQPEEMPRAQ